jgi:site-specific recombinase XerD
MDATFTAVFNRKGRLNKKGSAPVEIRAYLRGKRTFIATGISILADEWDAKKHEINKNHPQAMVLNAKIQSLITKLEKRQLQSMVDETPYDLSVIQEVKSRSNGSYIEFVKEELDKDRNLQESTKTGHRNTLNKLLEFTKGKDILFNEISFDFVRKFLNYLLDQGLVENTVHKQHKNMKKFMDLAINKGLYKHKNPCNGYKIKYVQKKRIVLTMEEINKLEELDLSGYDEKLNAVRDMFLLACFTGLRISDANNLKTKSIRKTKDGYEIDLVTVKVNKRAHIPLHNLFRKSGEEFSRPEKIIMKYLDENNELIFPKMSDPFVNRQLKVLQELTNITTILTFHLARHSFGTYMACKIPLPSLMFLMQHSDIKTTMVYVNMSQDMVQQGLLKVDWD